MEVVVGGVWRGSRIINLLIGMFWNRVEYRLIVLRFRSLWVTLFRILKRIVKCTVLRIKKDGGTNQRRVILLNKFSLTIISSNSKHFNFNLLNATPNPNPNPTITNPHKPSLHTHTNPSNPSWPKSNKKWPSSQTKWTISPNQTKL